MARVWSDGTLFNLMNPKDWILSNSDVIVIADKYPKAKFHFLILPRKKISSIFELNEKHFDLLEDMYMMASRVIAMHGKKMNNFKIGYHAESTIKHLLLNVISMDFNSPSLRTQICWNSFNTQLFISHHELLQQICKHGQISRLEPDQVESLRSTPLKCHRCNAKPSNMQALKQHLRVHSN